MKHNEKDNLIKSKENEKMIKLNKGKTKKIKETGGGVGEGRVKRTHIFTVVAEIPPPPAPTLHSKNKLNLHIPDTMKLEGLYSSAPYPSLPLPSPLTNGAHSGRLFQMRENYAMKSLSVDPVFSGHAWPFTKEEHRVFFFFAALVLGQLLLLHSVSLALDHQRRIFLTHVVLTLCENKLILAYRQSTMQL